MKLTITNGVVTAQSENKKEALMLVELSFKEEPEEKSKAVKRRRSRSPLYEKNRLFYKKRLALKASDVFPFK